MLLESPRKPRGLGDMVELWQPQGGTAWLPCDEELPGWPLGCASGKKQDKPLVPCSRPLPQPLGGADPIHLPAENVSFIDVQLIPHTTLVLTCHTSPTGRDPAARSSVDMVLDFFDTLVNKLPVSVEEFAAQFAAYRLTWKYFCSLCCCWGELRDVCLQ